MTVSRNTAELFNLTRKQLKLPGPRVLGSCFVAVATIVDPKNRAFMGRVQVRMVRDVNTVLWLLWLCRHLEPNDHIWPFSEYRFQQCLRICCSFYGVENIGFTPASMTAGGATHLLESGVAVGTIKFSGKTSYL